MLKVTRNFVIGLGMVWGAAQAATGNYKIDPSHSELEFEVTHMVISEVKGNFNEFDGTMKWDQENPKNSSVEVVIQTKSIDTDDKKRDDHLRSPDFFNAEKNPTLTFKSKSIEKKGDQYQVKGDLAMNGVTREVTFPFTVKGPVVDPWGNTRVGISGNLTVDRKLWKIEWNKALDAGGVLVGDDVKINIESEWIRQAEKQ